MTTEEIFDFAKASDLKMLRALIPFLRGFAIFYREDGSVAEHVGNIPRHFPDNLASIQSYLTTHPATELPTETEIAVGEFDGYIVHLMDGKLVCSYPLTAMLVAIPSDQQVDRLLSALPTGVIKLDSFWHATYCNEYAELMLGMSSDEIFGRGWLNTLEQQIIEQTVEYFQDATSFGKPFKTETQLITPMGTKRILSIQISAAYNFDHSINEYYLVFQDITSEHAANKKAQYLSTHDSLTGLKNRSYLLQKIEETIDQHSILESALIYIDLNDFKIVNDTYGHEAGDKVLKVAAQRLANAVRDQDVVARIGGDEFVLFLRNVSQEDLLNSVASKIQNALNQPISLDNGVTIDLISSLGLSHGAAISFIMDDNKSINIDNWLRSADIAMYTSKEKHDGTFEVFDESFHQVKQAEKNQFQALKTMVEDNAIDVHFQPILNSGQLVAVEALSRFAAPDLTMGPAQVINLAKKYNYISILFYNLLQRGLAAYKTLIDQFSDGAQVPLLNINVDIEMLNQVEFPQQCLAIVNELKIPANTIYLEFKEKILESDIPVVEENIKALKRSGFKLCIDNFGTGLISVEKILEFEFDQIKIDRSLFVGASSNNKMQTSLNALVKLGHALDLDVIGIGIETESEAALAKEMGIWQFQGFYFCKPENPAIIGEWLKKLNKIAN